MKRFKAVKTVIVFLVLSALFFNRAQAQADQSVLPPLVKDPQEIGWPSILPPFFPPPGYLPRFWGIQDTDFVSAEPHYESFPGLLRVLGVDYYAKSSGARLATTHHFYNGNFPYKVDIYRYYDRGPDGAQLLDRTIAFDAMTGAVWGWTVYIYDSRSRLIRKDLYANDTATNPSVARLAGSTHYDSNTGLEVSGTDKENSTIYAYQNGVLTRVGHRDSQGYLFKDDFYESDGKTIASSEIRLFGSNAIQKDQYQNGHLIKSEWYSQVFRADAQGSVYVPDKLQSEKRFDSQTGALIEASKYFYNVNGLDRIEYFNDQDQPLGSKQYDPQGRISRVKQFKYDSTGRLADSWESNIYYADETSRYQDRAEFYHNGRLDYASAYHTDEYRGGGFRTFPVDTVYYDSRHQKSRERVLQYEFLSADSILAESRLVKETVIDYEQGVQTGREVTYLVSDWDKNGRQDDNDILLFHEIATGARKNYQDIRFGDVNDSGDVTTTDADLIRAMFLEDRSLLAATSTWRTSIRTDTLPRWTLL